LDATSSPRGLTLPMTDKEMALNYLRGPFKGTTKEEMFKNLVEYEKNVLKTSDLKTKNVLHGTSSLSSLEKTLNNVNNND
jgi:hypothetical protein